MNYWLVSDLIFFWRFFTIGLIVLTDAALVDDVRDAWKYTNNASMAILGGTFLFISIFILIALIFI